MCLVLCTVALLCWNSCNAAALRFLFVGTEGQSPSTNSWWKTKCSGLTLECFHYWRTLNVSLYVWKMYKILSKATKKSQPVILSKFRLLFAAHFWQLILCSADTPHLKQYIMYSCVFAEQHFLSPSALSTHGCTVRLSVALRTQISVRTQRESAG